jgi:ATP-dependent Lon protease
MIEHLAVLKLRNDERQIICLTDLQGVGKISITTEAEVWGREYVIRISL